MVMAGRFIWKPLEALPLPCATACKTWTRISDARGYISFGIPLAKILCTLLGVRSSHVTQEQQPFSPSVSSKLQNRGTATFKAKHSTKIPPFAGLPTGPRESPTSQSSRSTISPLMRTVTLSLPHQTSNSNNCDYKATRFRAQSTGKL